jgi:hypothetical protein
MIATSFTIAAWVLIALAIVLCTAASAARATVASFADRRVVIGLRRAAVWVAGLAVICAVVGLLEPLPAGGGDRPAPQPSCAYLVDFPDSDPPRYDVCVPVEEAG